MGTKVIVATGESNSGGFARNTSASGAELASRSVVQMWHPTADTFQDLDVGTNNNVDHDGLDSTTHGWELQLANDVASGAESQDPVYYIQTGQGGSVISDWDVADPYWVEWLDRIGKAKTYFTNNSITPEWVVWMSFGINDQIAGTNVSTWKTSTIAWIDRIKAELSGAKILMSELTVKSALDPYIAAIREISDDEDDVILVAAEGLSERDQHHWNYAGMKTLSTRFLRSTQIALGERPGFIWSEMSSSVSPVDTTVEFGATASTGCISKEAYAWADGAYIIATTDADSQSVVVALESTKDTVYTWNSSQTYLFGAFRFNGTLFRSTGFSNATGIGAEQTRMKIQRSGDDAEVYKDNGDDKGTRAGTQVGVFTGITEVYVKLINATATATTIDVQKPPILSLSVTAPALNDIVLADAATTITWDTGGVAGTVDISRSKDSGATYASIASAQTNDGSYAWTPASGDVSATAKIKVTETADAANFAESPLFKVATTTAASGTSSSPFHQPVFG